MAEYTDRLGIRLIGGGASGVIPDEVVNVDVINVAWEKIDDAVGAPGVTSGTRPNVPYDGQMVWETNTERLLRWNAQTSQWHVVAEKTPFASNSETQEGTADSLAVTPAGLASLTATTTRRGLAEIATDAEAIARTDTTRYLTPANLDAAMKDRPVQGVIPSSVVVGSGSASVAADGTVTFTGVSSVSLNDVFDGLGADAYMIATRFTTAGSAAVFMRGRASGVDQSGSVYSYVALNSILGSGPGRSATSTATGIYLTPSNFQADGSTTIHLYSPALPAVWSFYDASTGAVGGGDRWFWTQAGALGSSAFDGFTLLLNAATTMSGTIKVVKIA